MRSQAAKQRGLFRKAYRWGMIGLLGVTAVTAGGRLLWERLSPKPEPTLSAQLTRKYFDRFSQLGVTAIKKESRSSDIEIDREGKSDLRVSELMCVVPAMPSGNPWPPVFDIQREGRMLNAYGPIDKDNFTLLEYEAAVASCLDAGLAEAAHAYQATGTWKRH